jgi:hypothetical protein
MNSYSYQFLASEVQIPLLKISCELDKMRGTYLVEKSFICANHCTESCHLKHSSNDGGMDCKFIDFLDLVD